MLQSISIKNVALIKNLVVDFNKGLNILLGETGAGKSIIFDALNFVLGAKLDKTLIRYGEQEMRVDAVFGMLNENSKLLLSELGFEDNEILLSRTLNNEGKSSIRINGNLSTQSILKEVGKILVDSYFQHESVELLKSKNHLAMLDKFGKEKINHIKENVKKIYSQYIEILNQMKKLGGDEFERARELSLLEYQIKEIEDANLQPGEDELLHEKLKLLNNSEKIYQIISACDEYLGDNSNSCISLLQQSIALLSNLTGFDSVEECKNRLESARYEIEDIYQTLTDIKEQTEYDENEYQTIDQRYDLIKSLTKKYGGNIEKTLEYLEKSKTRYNELNDSEVILKKLEKQKEELLKQLSIFCDELTEKRKKVANEIETKIVKELKELGMKSSKFEVNFTKLSSFTNNGCDNVEFVFSANKGQEVKSLAKTASGGELSRFMLAIKNIFAEIGSAETLIFDEIDSGISGETGKIVGEKLHNITQFAQVICITHLPQVACYGNEFYFVSKFETENETLTKVEKLEGKEIPFNIARMIVGDNVSDIALSQAKEMINEIKSK